MRVLLLEDEDAIRSAMLRGLEASGHAVLACASLSDARAQAPAFRAQALVSDLKLNDGSGVELARELAIPSVFMSGYATTDDVIAALRAGAVEFLTKPASLRDIRRAIERIALAGDGGPLVVDAQGEVRVLRAARDAIHAHVLSTTSVAWSDADDARHAFAAALPWLPRLVHRRIAAELIQHGGPGRLIINRGEREWTCMRESSVRVPADVEHMLADVARQVRSDGPRLLVAVGDEAAGDHTATVHAQRPSGEEWLWPHAVNPGDPLDLGHVVAVGCWFLDWLRQRPGLGVVSARPAVRRLIEQAGVSVCWLDQPRVRPGVSLAERAALIDT